MKKIILIFSVIATLFTTSCQEKSNLEGKVNSLEKELKELKGQKNASVQDIINNPATINNPNQEIVIDGPVAAMTMNELEHDFGTITAGDEVSHVFSFTNTGENPLIITNARGSCGCTVPEYPRTPIAPGEKGEILVKFNSKGKVGQQRKSVTVTANTNPATTQFFITSNVLKAEVSDAPLAQPVTK